MDIRAFSKLVALSERLLGNMKKMIITVILVIHTTLQLCHNYAKYRQNLVICPIIAYLAILILKKRMQPFINLLTLAEVNRRGLEVDSLRERKIVLLIVDSAKRKFNFKSCQCICCKI